MNSIRRLIKSSAIGWCDNDNMIVRSSFCVMIFIIISIALNTYPRYKIRALPMTTVVIIIRYASHWNKFLEARTYVCVRRGRYSGFDKVVKWTRPLKSRSCISYGIWGVFRTEKGCSDQSYPSGDMSGELIRHTPCRYSNNNKKKNTS